MHDCQSHWVGWAGDRISGWVLDWVVDQVGVWVLDFLAGFLVARRHVAV